MWKVLSLSFVVLIALAPAALARRPCGRHYSAPAAPAASGQAPADQASADQAQRSQANRSYSYEPSVQTFDVRRPSYGYGSQRSPMGWHSAGFKARGRYNF